MSDIKFDPQTGEPIQQPVETTAEAVDQTVTEPVQQAAEPVQAAAEVPAQAADTNAQPAPKKGKTGKIIAGVIAAAAVITGGVFGARNLGGGGSPVDIINQAAQNTFVSDEMTDNLKAAVDITKDGTYAIDAALNVEGTDVKARYDADGGNLSLDVEAMGMGAKLYMDDKKITVDASKIADVDPISYDYTSDKSGAGDTYLGQMAGAETLEEIDSMLKMLYSAASNPAEQEKVEEATNKKLEELEYEELEKKEIKLGDQTVNCGGYETTVTGEYIYDLLNQVYEESYGKSLDEMMDEISSMGAEAGEVDDIKSQLQSIEEIDLKYYINEDKFAMINVATKVDDEDVDVEIYFEGKDIPWHDMTIKNVDGGEEIKLKTTDEDGKLVYEIQADGETQGSLSYSKDDGKFEVISYDETQLVGTLKADGSDVVIVIEEAGGMAVDAQVTITDDAKVDKAPESKDILEMSETDFSDFANKLISVFYGLE